MGKTVLLSAGGTGGHLFPAQALAQELRRRGWTIHLATDPRAKRFAADFEADETHIVRSATFAGKSPIALAKTFLTLAGGYFAARRLIGQIKPDVAVGFGGYPTVPPLLAAIHKKVPSILHEQNAILGRANRFLAPRISVLATGFELRDDTYPYTVTGNPLRAIAHEAANIPYAQPESGGVLKLLIFGGSQGAQFFSRVTADALALLEAEELARVELTMQVREEEMERTKAALDSLSMNAQLSPFFLDMPQLIAQSHLVMCRSGASSVSELALIGRPSILVPLPGSLDDDQGANAAQLEAEGGAVLVRQKDLSPSALSEFIRTALQKPDALAIQAAKAKKAGVTDAAARLADLVESQD